MHRSFNHVSQVDAMPPSSYGSFGPHPIPKLKPAHAWFGLFWTIQYTGHASATVHISHCYNAFTVLKQLSRRYHTATQCTTHND